MKKVADLRVRRGEMVEELIKKLGTTGFQASNISRACDIIKRMRESDATTFLTFTANIMASGVRGILTQMVEEGLVDAVVTTGGSVDHDIIKSYKSYGMGDYETDDVKLHRQKVNRIGNILVPNSRYSLLEKKMKSMYQQLNKKTKVFSPTQMNDFIGKKLPKSSFLNACHRKKVPVFCPGMIDSAVGMHLYFYRQYNREFTMDPAIDLEKLSDIVFTAKETGGIVLGGGISKHHLIGANLLRGGLDYAVYVTTASEYDGSLSGARPSEAISWGKIKEKARTVVVVGDVSIILPLIKCAV